MVHITTESLLPAPPARVWEALTDFASYPRWNPFLVQVRVEGPLQPGARVAGRASLGASGGGRTLGITARVVECEVARRLSWRGGVPGLLVGWHAFALEPAAGGATRLLHSERFTGLLPLLAGARLRRLTAQYEAMNAALAAVLQGR
jgi:hypothetical protein